MKTETKIVTSILAFTALIIFGGILIVKNNFKEQNNNDYSKYIETGLQLDQTKIARDYNPKITGYSSTTSTTTIRITEFLDYECFACAKSGEMLTKVLLNKYGSNIIITRKIFPLHGQASIDVASIVLASQILGNKAYQDIHAKVYEEFDSWSRLGKKEKDDYLKKLIINLGYDYEKILAESKNEKYKKEIEQDKQDAISLGVKATPTFIIENHTRITGGIPPEEMYKYILAK